MAIRQMEDRDLGQMLLLWNESVAAGEVVYRTLTEAFFQEKFFENPSYDPAFTLVADEGGRVCGFISGIMKKEFLPGETHASTPGYITCIFVAKAHRGKGIGTVLLAALEDRFKKSGKKSAGCSGDNPIKLDWIVPGTKNHDHNNAPGVDEACLGHAFLLKRGYADTYREVAMYLNLQNFIEAPDLAARQERLASEGIATGRYDVSLQYDFDRMCDRVQSEYWRKVLQDETAKENPRTILAATHEGHIVAFTGPVDRQPSGRGWFSGICTDPAFERRGIATVLFNLLMKEFIQIGAEFSTLFTGDDNHAQMIYKRTGFEIVRRFVIMSKPL